MTLPYLVAQFGMWMIGALVIGLVTGAIAARTRRNARLERSDVDAPFGCCGDILHSEARKSGGRRVGAMRTFGDQNDRTVLTAGVKRSLYRKDTAQFAMRTRLGRHRDAVHSGKVD